MGAIESNGLTATFQVDRQQAIAYLKDRKTGGVVGRVDASFTPEVDAYTVYFAQTDEGVPKKAGIGRDLYTRLDAEVKRRTGKRLGSEHRMFQQPGATGMWDALVRSGKAKGPVGWPGRDDPKYSYYVFEDSGTYGIRRQPVPAMRDIYPTDDDRETEAEMGGRKLPEWKDELCGGEADDMEPDDFDADELVKGMEDEREHTDDPHKQAEIAMDHLSQDPRYYSKREEGMRTESRTPRMAAVFGLVSESGERFKRLTRKLSKKGVRDPAGLAASIGRKKFGKKKFQRMAAKGRKG